MGENVGNAGAERVKVIDFSRYRAERAQRDLPLFARAGETSACPELTVARALQPREVAHRERMLQFLRTTS